MPELEPCPLCAGTNVHMLNPEQVDAVSWVCAIECQDCQVVVQPNYCEPDAQSAQYSARVDWNRRPDTAIPADQVLVPRTTLERFMQKIHSAAQYDDVKAARAELRALLQP